MGVNDSSLSGKAHVALPLERFVGCFTESDMNILLRRYRNKIDNFAIDQGAFTLMFGNGETQDSLQDIFRLLDSDNDGVIDALEALLAVALVSKLPLEKVQADILIELFNFRSTEMYCTGQVAELSHELFDFDDSDSLTFDELSMVLRTLCSAACKVDPSCTMPELVKVEQIAAAIFVHASGGVEKNASRSTSGAARKTSKNHDTESKLWSEECTKSAGIRGVDFALDGIAPTGEVSRSQFIGFLQTARQFHRVGEPQEQFPPSLLGNREPGLPDRGSDEEKALIRQYRQQYRCTDLVSRFLNFWTPTVTQAAPVPDSGWADPLFPAAATSLYIDPERPPLGLPAPECVQWIRASVLAAQKPRVFVGNQLKGHIRRGALADDWFLGAVAAVAFNTRQHEFGFRDLFLETGQEADGRYCVRFFKDAFPIHVYIDDYIPCDMGGKPLFASSDLRAEIWPMLLEKAYAKLHGCYENLLHGRFEYALKDVTGRFVHALDLEKRVGSRVKVHDETLESPNTVETVASNVWGLVNEAFRAGHLLTATRSVPRREDAFGIETRRPYVVVDTYQAYSSTFTSNMEKGAASQSLVQLVRLKNCWGNKTWRGAWSPGSPQWKAHNDVLHEITQLEDQTTGLESRTYEGDSARESNGQGVFWISALDFCEVFSTVHICGAPPAAPGHAVSYEGEWTRTTAGGNWHHKTWLRNPQYALHLQQDAEVMISLRQLPDKRYRTPRVRGNLSSDSTPSPIRADLPSDKLAGLGFVVLAHPFTVGATRPARLTIKLQAEHPSQDPKADLQICTDTFDRVRATDTISFFPQGRYVIVPMTERPGVVGKFVLSVGSAAKFTLLECAAGESTQKIRDPRSSAPAARRQPFNTQASHCAGSEAALQYMQKMVSVLRSELGELKVRRDQMAEALRLLD